MEFLTDLNNLEEYGSDLLVFHLKERMQEGCMHGPGKGMRCLLCEECGRGLTQEGGESLETK